MFGSIELIFKSNVLIFRPKELTLRSFLYLSYIKGSKNPSYIRGADIIYYRTHLAKSKNRTDLICTKFKYSTALITSVYF